MNNPNEIPPITDPLGKHWKQPSRDRILVDDKYAVMEPSTFKALPEYSASLPSGVYNGKMWRLNDFGVWLLCWYGPSADPTLCSVNTRRILIVAEAIDERT